MFVAKSRTCFRTRYRRSSRRTHSRCRRAPACIDPTLRARASERLADDVGVVVVALKSAAATATTHPVARLQRLAAHAVAAADRELALAALAVAARDRVIGWTTRFEASAAAGICRAVVTARAVFARRRVGGALAAVQRVIGRIRTRACAGAATRRVAAGLSTRAARWVDVYRRAGLIIATAERADAANAAEPHQELQRKQRRARSYRSTRHTIDRIPARCRGERSWR